MGSGSANGTGEPPVDPDSLLDSTMEIPGARRGEAEVAIHPFESLNEEILSLIQRNMTEQRFGPGERLITQGEPGTSLMVVAEGEVEVSVEAGGRHHLLKRAGAGEILGEMALLTKEPRMASVTAMTLVMASVMTS